MKDDKTKKKVVIADKQFLIIESLKSIIQDSDNYSFVALSESFSELKDILESNEIDILITDHNIIDYNDLILLADIRSDFPKTNILILTNQINKNELNELAAIGIKNVIYKTADRDELFMAMDTSVRNKKFYSEEIIDILMEENNFRNENAENNYLTPSEIEIVKLIASGLTTKQMAEKKHVSFHTIVSHRKNIFRKLGINSVSELLMYAVKTGIIADIEYYI